MSEGFSNTTGELNYVLNLTKNRLSFAVDKFDLFYPKKVRFLKEVRLAWEEVQPMFVEVHKMIPEMRDELAKIGLGGNQLKFKVIVLDDYDKRLTIAWSRYNRWMSMIKNEQDLRRKQRPRLRRIVDLLGKFFGQADTIIDTMCLVIPNAHGIKEFKETLERF